MLDFSKIVCVLERNGRNIMKIKEVLKRASEEGASDVHFTAGLPPKMRLSGSLVSMPYESLTGEDTMAAASFSDAVAVDNTIVSP